MPRLILLPKELDEKLQILTELEEETNGVLFYKREDLKCPVDHLYLTGLGTVGHVQALPERIEVVNKFFEKNPDYHFIKFHTHSCGTIKTFGDYYAKKFSQGDRDGIKEQLRRDKEFIAMLVTPETRLLSGFDNPTLEIIDSFPEYEERNKYVKESIHQIAEEIRIEHERLKGTIRK